MHYRAALAPVLAILLLAGASPFVQAEDWQPISPDELAMTSEPLAPGAPAIYLYRQVDRDDSGHEERVYERIKILTDAGRDRANIKLQYTKNSQSIAFIKARLIRPDGTISNFDGKIDDKSLVSAGDQQLMAKTFTLPLATVGSILELRYTLRLDYRYIYDSHWILNADLFTRFAKFSLRPAEGFALTYSWPRGLPTGTNPPLDKHSQVELEVRNVPAFVSEEFMPPEDEMKYRVDFIYSNDEYVTKDPVEYWKHFGKQTFRTAEHFMDEPRAMQRAVAQIVTPADDAETKLRKLYARVLQMRNLDYESDLSQQERAKLKDNDDVEDVWDHGYGSGNQLTLLYAALARAAGTNADIVFVSTRDQYIFNPRIMNSSQLNAYVVLVNLNGRQMFLDPGVAFTRFGFLPWFESSVQGLKLDKNGGAWIATYLPSAFASRTERRATLHLGSDGSLSGKLQVSYTGQDAAWRRASERLNDATARAKFLEDEVHGSVAVGINVTLTSQPDWDSAENPLTAEFDISIPGYAESAGRRMLLPMGVFDRDDRHTFEHAEREHPIYFRYLSERIDSLDIELPESYQLTTLPAARDSNLTTMAYHIGVEQDGGSVHVRRSLIENAIIIPASNYPGVREFFQSVRAGDEQQLVLNYDASQVHH
jgi:hypothetical protein